MTSSREREQSRHTVAAVNLAKLLLIAALTPPVVIGIAQRAEALGAGTEVAAIVAMTATAGSLAAILGAYLAGVLSDLVARPDAHGARWVSVLFATGVGTLGLLLLVFGDSQITLVGGWAGAQLGYSGAVALLRVILAGTLPTHRRRGAIISVLGGYAGIVVPLLLLLIAPGSLWGTTLGLAALCFVVPIVLLWRMRRVELTGVPTPQQPPEPREARAVPVPGLLVIQCLASMVLAAFISYHPLDLAQRAETAAGFPVRESVWVLIAAVLGLLVVSSLLLWRPRALANSSRVLAVAGIALAVSLVLRAVGESLPAIAAAAFVSGAAVGVTTSALLASALESAPNDRRGGFIGAYSAVGSLGQMLGPLLGLGIFTLSSSILPGAGYRPMFWALAVLPAAWAVWLWTRGRVSRRTTAPVAEGTYPV